MDNLKVLVDNTDKLTTEEWLNERRKGIGGSDAASAIGVSTWKSPVTLWLEKTGQFVPEQKESEPLFWGKRLEGIVADRFAELHPNYTIEPINKILVNPQHSYMIADIDRMVTLPDGRIGVLECKTASESSKQFWDEGDVPIQYTMQVQHYLAVTGAQFAWIACLLGGNKWIERYIERDDELIDRMIQLEGEFWKCVQDNESPDYDGTSSAWDALKALYPTATAGKEIELPYEVLADIENYEKVNERVKEYEQTLKEITKVRDSYKQKIIAAMGDAEKGTIGDYTIKYTNIERKEHVVAATTYRKFSMKRG